MTFWCPIWGGAQVSKRGFRHAVEELGLGFTPWELDRLVNTLNTTDNGEAIDYRSLGAQLARRLTNCRTCDYKIV